MTLRRKSSFMTVRRGDRASGHLIRQHERQETGQSKYMKSAKSPENGYNGDNSIDCNHHHGRPAMSELTLLQHSKQGSTENVTEGT